MGRLISGQQRTSSVPRSNASTPRNARGPTRPPAKDSRTQSAADLKDRDIGADLRGSGAPKRGGGATVSSNTNGNSNGSISIRGAAGGPYVVVASNFAPGTTAADIESVMRGVGGEILYCRLVASTPTVIAEMGFPELGSADKVIATFNNKKVRLRWNMTHLWESRWLTDG